MHFPLVDGVDEILSAVRSLQRAQTRLNKTQNNMSAKTDKIQETVNVSFLNYPEFTPFLSIYIVQASTILKLF